MTQQHIRTKLEKAAKTIATLHTVQWAGWIIYILEALADYAPKSVYRQFLRDVREYIDIYFREGDW